MDCVSYPKKIAIGFQEGTCPLKCKKCYAFGKSNNATKEVSKMELSKAKQLIDEISKLAAESGEDIFVQPVIQAEPFTNPDLMQIMRYCNVKNLGMHIITNGILVNNEWKKFILEEMNEKYSISFSLDAVTQETYEKVRGQYLLSDVEATIIYLLKNRKHNLPRIIVNFTVEEDNEHEINLFIDKWKYLADAVSIGTCLDDERKIPFKYRKESYGKYFPCETPFRVMAIDWDGSVRICQMDAFGESYLGNVFDEGILKIWNGKKYMEMRSRHEQNTIDSKEFCSGCDGRYAYGHKRRETEEFVINEGISMIFYNHKGESKIGK